MSSIIHAEQVHFQQKFDPHTSLAPPTHGTMGPMFALFEDAGKFNTGKVLSDTDTSSQIELESGKRVKVKATHVLLRFGAPAPAILLEKAHEVRLSMDIALAYEFAPQEEFTFQELAHEYFSAQAPLEEQLGSLFLLFEHPHYFRRVGKGRFKKADPQVIEQALMAIEKKRLIQEKTDAWAAQLIEGVCAPEIAQTLFKILFKPDKNAPEFKAVAQAAKSTGLAALTLLQKAGAIQSAYQFHWQRFLFDQFPKGTAFPPLPTHHPALESALEPTLDLAPVQAFSIDDSQTTEIDDALSLTGLGESQVTLGIHIAAPGLALQVDDPLDQVAKSRLSTVYMPGHKITMLPKEVVERFTLIEGRDCPALSLYLSFDAEHLNILKTDTKIERVHIAANLRHDLLETWIDEAWIEGPDPWSDGADRSSLPAKELLPIEKPHATLNFLLRVAKHLKRAREVVRGKPETFNRPDYNFKLIGPSQAQTLALQKGSPPSGEERVLISPRMRGSALDLIVAEAMILANSQWGRWMADLGVPAIYRSQASLSPGVKVRMSTQALPHAGMGVSCYAWSTSPLRRYTDLVNQWQLIACVRQGKTAALACPFKPKDTALFAIISSFDTAYSAYNAHQQSMERFWTLKYVQDQSHNEYNATVIKHMPGQPILARLDELPLVFELHPPKPLQRGQSIRVSLHHIDLISLNVEAQFIQSLGADHLPSELAFNALDLFEMEDSDMEHTGSLTSLKLELDVVEDEPGSNPETALPLAAGLDPKLSPSHESPL